MFNSIEDSCLQSSEKELPEINVLLLGETGAGKSTTLNALANYFRYDFDSALKPNNPLTIAEQFKITRLDPVTGDEKIYNSGPGVGKNSNLSNLPGDSQSIETVGYLFEFKDRCRLRIIDTPGIGDTKGNDIKNFGNIMSYLEEHEELNAVVIVTDGSSNRTSTFFKYCNAELLTRLHKSASKNIMFLFTFSRSSNFGAGEGYSIVKRFLEEELADKVDELTLKPAKNCFFIDNEAFIYLMAQKRGYMLNFFLRESCRNSWENSVEQIEKMMQQILQSQPHNLKETRLLNEARKIIVEFSQPIVHVELNIRKNIEHIKKENKNWQIQDSPMDSLLEPSQTLLDVVKLVEMKKACTVCTSSKCTEIIKSKVDGKDEKVYKRCHEGCGCILVKRNTKGQWNLLTCEVIKWVTADDDMTTCFPELKAQCKVCKCNWSQHIHIYAQYETERVYALERPDEVLKELEEELATVKDCNNKFAHILRKNTPLKQNKYFTEYLDKQIDLEYQVEAEEPEQDSANKQTLLRQIKREYEQSVKQFNQAIENNTIERVSIEVVPKLKDKLCRLKYSGPQFKQILQTQQKFANKRADVMVASVPNSNNFFKLFTQFF